jgi:hypothetical protein
MGVRRGGEGALANPEFGEFFLVPLISGPTTKLVSQGFVQFGYPPRPSHSSKASETGARAGVASALHSPADGGCPLRPPAPTSRLARLGPPLAHPLRSSSLRLPRSAAAGLLCSSLQISPVAR